MERSVLQQARALPDRIGPYQIERQLSGSGSLQVYLAREDGPVGFSRDVVLKVASNALDDDARSIKELGREATACAKLNHPGIVRTYQFIEHGHALVLVLEYVDGISLGDLLATKPVKGERLLTDDAAFHVGLSILEALAHAHGMLDERGAGAPVVHRAVSPSNILIGRDGSVKLGGFGFARVSGVGAGTTGSLTWEPAYMAPEQVTEQQLSPKVDVYAAGLILWELLTGRQATNLPRDPLAIEAMLRAVIERKVEPLATLRRDLPRELVAVVDASLEPSHLKRMISCAEMARWIEKVAYVGEGKKELAALVRARIADVPRAATAPVTAVPVVAAVPPVAAVPVVPPTPIAGTNLGFSKGPAKKDRTLLGVAPPALKDTRPRAASLGTPPVAASRPLPTPPPSLVPRTIPSPVVAIGGAPVVAARLPPPPAALPFAATMVAPPIAVAPPISAWPAAPPGFLASPPAGTPAGLSSVASTPTAQQGTPSADVASTVFASSEDVLPVNRQLANLARLWSRLGAPALDRMLSFVKTLPLPKTLHAPNWNRKTWMTAWIGLGAALIGLVGALTIGTCRSSAAANPKEPELAASAVLVAPPAALPSPDLAPDPAPDPVPAPSPAPSSPPSFAEADVPARTPEAPLDSDHGYLTIHSRAAYANVYVLFTRFGRVEQQLSIPCGRRFVSIGVPAPGRREPVWLAPGRFMQIPCGGSHEVTMNPRPLKARAEQ